MQPPRYLILALGISAALVLLAVGAVLLRGSAESGRADRSGGPAADRSQRATPRTDERTAQGVRALRDWDAARARAWGSGDAEALRALYTASSPVAGADVAMLRQWQRRDLRVTGMRTQVLRVSVRASAADRMVLEVTDRLAGAVAVRDGTRVPLPRDRVSTRLVALVHTHGRWRVAAVMPVDAGEPTAGVDGGEAVGAG